MTFVYILCITHRHGQELFAHATYAGARRRLALFVREWWGDPHGFWAGQPATAPEDDDRAIACYFEAMGDEDWTGLQVAVGD